MNKEISKNKEQLSKVINETYEIINQRRDFKKKADCDRKNRQGYEPIYVETLYATSLHEQRTIIYDKEYIR